MSDGEVPKTAVVVEDDPDVRHLLAEVLESAGFSTIAVDNGIDGVRAVLAHQPLITTLDVNMPGIDGFEAARRIRAQSDTLIIMLTALDEEADVVLGLSAGADVYLNKPFRPRELRARIDALLRRSRPAAPGSAPAPQNEPASPGSVSTRAGSEAGWTTHRDLRLNADARIVLVQEREVDLTRTEFDLLSALMESKRRVRSKTDLAVALRGGSQETIPFVGDADKRAVEAHMTNLRRKLGDHAVQPRYIETVRGVGYRLTADISN
ncbi:response regulator transcription factor [Microbacterium sp. MAHUQ-60]|uniref:response regulator transcription factor n=1 Tax=unclassified Microbacterium TaxID=2609290 RepID=UPI00360C3622